LASVSLLYVSLYSGKEWLQAALRNRFLVYTGTISYGLYLLHKIPFDWGMAQALDRYAFFSGPILFGASYWLAALVRNPIENPFLIWKCLFETKPVASHESNPHFAVRGNAG